MDINITDYNKSEYSDYFSEDISLNTKVFFYIYMIIIPVGLIGNVFSFCVLMRREIRKTSTAIYLITLSIADTLSLLGGPMVDMILASDMFVGWYWPIQNTLSCQFFNFFYFWNPIMSAWCLVSVTVERVIVIYFPHRYAVLLCCSAPTKYTTNLVCF